MKHVALIIPGFRRLGGAEQQVIQLAKGLHQRGWRVSVVTLSRSPSEQIETLFPPGTSVVNLGMRKGLADPRGWIRFHRWLKRERPDIVHAHLPHAVWMARWSRLAAPMRVLVDTIHTSATGGLGRRLGYRWSRWLPDQVTAVSQAVAQAYINARMAGNSNLTVLANGVDTHSWRPNPQSREQLRRQFKVEEKFLWFTAGRLDPVKDYPTLLAAFCQVPEPARLVIAGSGPMQAELLQLTKELHLESRVTFLGFTPNVAPWLQAADAFVLASQWEGLPIALLEASACAVPAVATNVPGTREVVADGVTGFLAESGNVPALQQAMVRMMQIPASERLAMGEKARQSTIERYSLVTVLDRLGQMYSELMRRNDQPTRWRKPGK
jgi:glycosyltransferase involved in cell wall biosynthesis